MAALQKFLRGLGPLGSLVANLLSFLTTNWVVTMTTVVSIAAGLSDWAVEFVHRPGVQTCGIVFLVLLWTWVGLTVLIDRRRPRAISTHPDYRYGLVFEGFIPTFVPTNAGMPSPGGMLFSIQIRNFSPSPVKYVLESCDIRIGSRTHDKYEPNKISGYMARGSGRQARIGGFPPGTLNEFFGNEEPTKGTADFAVCYGPPDGPSVRRLKLSLDFLLVFPKDGAVNASEGQGLGYSDSIKSEVDEPIGGTV